MTGDRYFACGFSGIGVAICISLEVQCFLYAVIFNYRKNSIDNILNNIGNMCDILMLTQYEN